MQEIPRLMDDHEFQKELERIREHLDAISKLSFPMFVKTRSKSLHLTFGMQKPLNEGKISR